MPDKGFLHRRRKQIKKNSLITGPEVGEQIKKIVYKSKKVSKKFVAVKNPMPFNLEMARNGVPLVNRNKQECIFIGFDNRLKNPLLIAAIGKVYDDDLEKNVTRTQLREFYADGMYYNDGTKHSSDVFMNVESKTQFVVLFHPDSTFTTWDTRKAAEEFIDSELMRKEDASIIERVVPVI